jgi:hypothetical protein
MSKHLPFSPVGQGCCAGGPMTTTA